ncbi:unnamed protein product [Calypogeia fissa]
MMIALVHGTGLAVLRHHSCHQRRKKRPGQARPGATKSEHNAQLAKKRRSGRRMRSWMDGCLVLRTKRTESRKRERDIDIVSIADARGKEREREKDRERERVRERWKGEEEDRG